MKTLLDIANEKLMIIPAPPQIDSKIVTLMCAVKDEIDLREPYKTVMEDTIYDLLYLTDQEVTKWLFEEQEMVDEREALEAAIVAKIEPLTDPEEIAEILLLECLDDAIMAHKEMNPD